MNNISFISTRSYGKKIMKIIIFCILTTFMLAFFASFAYAAPSEDQQTDLSEQSADPTSAKAIAAAIAIGLGTAAGAIAMGNAIAKSSESIARQPEAEEKIRNNLMLGLVFLETAIIYALVISIIIIFVL